MLFIVNVLLQRTGTPYVWDEASPQRERILWVDAAGKTCVLIALDAAAAWPTQWSCMVLANDIAYGLLRVVQDDPYSDIYQPESAFSAQQLAQRDAAWAYIRSMVTEHSADLFHAPTLGPLVREAAAQAGKHKKQIYRYLRRYWQGGQVPNALIPHFERRGGQGKSRPCAPDAPQSGRKNSLAVQTGEGVGVNIDAHIQAIFRRGSKLYIEREGMRISDAFRALSKDAFATDEMRNGVVTPVLLPAEERPTLAQFRYWYEQEANPAQALIAREGLRRYQLHHRPVLGSPRYDLLGPGSMYYYDATIGDVYLVSQFNRHRIIGRPVIHLVVDLFSGLIAGVAVLLKGPSWVGAMLALENMTLDKATFCAEYGITINVADWPAQHVPFAITGDRGELFSHDAEAVIRALHLRIVTTPPYRPDWKPVIERNFRTLNDLVIHWLPGAVTQPRERGERDYRLDACLTLVEFRQILLHSIVTYNRSHATATDHFDTAMLTAGVEPYPRDLWQWGIEQRNGQLRHQDQDAMRRCLLPERTASVQGDGLHFDGLRYTCATALRDHWFVRTRPGRRSVTVPIVIDPRTRRHVYLRTPPGTPLEVCPVLDRDHLWGGGDWYDVDDALALQRVAQQARRPSQEQAYIDHEAFRDQIVADAQRHTAEARPEGESKAARVRAICPSRQAERANDRSAGAWPMGSPDAAVSPPPPSLDAATARRLALLASDDDVEDRE